MKRKKLKNVFNTVMTGITLYIVTYMRAYYSGCMILSYYWSVFILTNQLRSPKKERVHKQ